MAQIVQDWVMNTLCLPFPQVEIDVNFEIDSPPEFRKALSNGVLFGRILRKYNVISDDMMITLHNHHYKLARLFNMDKLLGWFRKAGLSVDSEELMDIAEETPGSAMKLLFRMYLVLEHPNKSAVLAGLAPKDPFIDQCSNRSDEEEIQRAQLAREKVPEKVDNLNLEIPNIPVKNKSSVDIPEPDKNDSHQAAMLYMQRRAREILLKQKVLLKTQWRPPVVVTFEPPRPRLNIAKTFFGYRLSILENQQTKWMNVQKQKAVRLLDEMDVFDAKLKTRLNEIGEEKPCTSKSISKKTKTEKPKPIRVYPYGLGNPEDLQEHMTDLKCRRQLETDLSKRREQRRRILSDQLDKSIVKDMDKDLEQSTLTKSFNQPEKESALMEFLQCNKEKHLFLNHLLDDKNQNASRSKQRRCFQLKELAELKKEMVSDFQDLKVDENNLEMWEILLMPSNVPYNKGAFKIAMKFPSEYPFRPPAVTFTTKIYHPNVDEKGEVCLFLIRPDNWKPATRIVQVLQELATLINEPQPEHALRADLAQQYNDDRCKYNKTAEEFTKKHAEKRPC